MVHYTLIHMQNIYNEDNKISELKCSTMLICHPLRDTDSSQEMHKAVVIDVLTCISVSDIMSEQRDSVQVIISRGHT